MPSYTPIVIKGAYQNFSETPQLAEGTSMLGVMKDFFTRPKTIAPSSPLPSIKTNLKALNSTTPTIIWFGHSSYLIHCQGINILVDPVLSGHASPFSWYLKAFKGSDIYKPQDMPDIDLMILTHNHYDHLDKPAVKALAPRTRAFIMPTGVSRDLEGMGISAEQITELSWWESKEVSPDIELTATPSRHFSGRGLKRNASLWASFVLSIKGYKIFIGSDSGYDSHFKEIGTRFGPFDIAILECGQYNKAWPYIHSEPEELIREGAELQAKVILPVHWAKFALALHEWDEPIRRFVNAADKADANYTTPMIGQPVVIDKHYPKEKWWE
jgi:L-ascorbate metabolism protein UlaG (beta-lactamase superfamily)